MKAGLQRQRERSVIREWLGKVVGKEGETLIGTTAGCA